MQNPGGVSFHDKRVSYIGKPRSNTAMYVSRKIEGQLGKLESVEQCLVFAETGIEVPDSLKKNHAVVLVDNPQLAYARLAIELEQLQAEEDRKLRYLHKDGSYISETAVIGKGTYIEQGCVIGHHVTIGDNAVLLNGAVVKHAVIGEGFLANEYAVIGANSFTAATDEKGNKMRIPTLGSVKIGDDVEIGVHNNVSRGSVGDTILEDHVKSDALVHIGHDVHISKNVEITAGVIIAGYATVGENAFLGVNATLRNRIEIGNGAFLGMGAVATKSVENGMVVAENPAKALRTVSWGRGGGNQQT